MNETVIQKPMRAVALFAIAIALAALSGLSPSRAFADDTPQVTVQVNATSKSGQPLTAEEADRIRCAQRARGARLDEGGPLRRLSSWGQVLVPLVVSLFRRADELASAMCDRCYSGEQTALLGPLGACDRALILLVAAWGVASLLL